MCARCDEYADQREAADDGGVPAKVYHAHDTGPTNSCRCEGCGERVNYNDIVRYDADEDQWWHEGCEDEPATAT